MLGGNVAETLVLFEPLRFFLAQFAHRLRRLELGTRQKGCPVLGAGKGRADQEGGLARGKGFEQFHQPRLRKDLANRPADQPEQGIRMQLVPVGPSGFQVDRFHPSPSGDFSTSSHAWQVASPRSSLKSPMLSEKASSPGHCLARFHLSLPSR